MVLIDTWWNVNPILIENVIFPSSFNRYMVECELRISLNGIYRAGGFNRYMVECECERYAVIPKFCCAF